jgi:alkanesulfonate monooxygenase
MGEGRGPELRLFATCPQSKDLDAEDYRERVAAVARWSEKAGFAGILVYADNGLIDPWLVAQVIVASTTKLSPLVAVQPIYMHPYSAAKMVASIGHLYGRRLCLNIVAGGFKNDLVALNDETPHDERYDRAVEYTLIVKSLLESPDPVSFAGKYYEVKNLRMTPPLPPELSPEVLISGSSEAGLAAARALGATPVKYPRAPGDEEAAEPGNAGIRVGIIAREDAEEAWAIAQERFPADRKGQITHALAMRISDSQWHKELSELGARTAESQSPYWLRPFENYKTFCPYLVGSYDRVAEEVARYLDLGFTMFILDIPPNEAELDHTALVFERARRRAQSVAGRAT